MFKQLALIHLLVLIQPLLTVASHFNTAREVLLERNTQAQQLSVRRRLKGLFSFAVNTGVSLLATRTAQRYWMGKPGSKYESSSASSPDFGSADQENIDLKLKLEDAHDNQDITLTFRNGNMENQHTTDLLQYEGNNELTMDLSKFKAILTGEHQDINWGSASDSSAFEALQADSIQADTLNDFLEFQDDERWRHCEIMEYGILAILALALIVAYTQYDNYNGYGYISYLLVLLIPTSVGAGCAFGLFLYTRDAALNSSVGDLVIDVDITQLSGVSTRGKTDFTLEVEGSNGIEYTGMTLCTIFLITALVVMVWMMFNPCNNKR